MCKENSGVIYISCSEDHGRKMYLGFWHTWLRHKGDSLQKWTKGEYDIVVWHARGRGDELDGLTMCVLRPSRLFVCADVHLLVRGR